MVLKIIRFLRGLAWGLAAAMALNEATELRYVLVRQESAMQQSAVTGMALCWLVTYLTVALAADRVLELSERNLRERLSTK